MGDTFSQILVQTTVRKAIRDIRKTPHRSTRNLIDMALNFSDGPSQNAFFQTTQKLLTDERSAYYTLLQDMALHIEEDRLLTFGMNIGYNSSVYGAKRIRQLKEDYGYSIPWELSLEVSRASLAKFEPRYHQVIEEGRELGIYTWMLFSDSCATECVELAAQHPDSAFILFCGRAEINWPLIDCASEWNNLMLVMPMDEDAPLVCGLLREAGLLYGLYTTYGEAELPRMKNGDIFCDMEQLNPVFSVFLPEPGCPWQVQKNVCDAIHKARMAQSHATILWELNQDCMRVGKIVSGSGFRAGFTKKGLLRSIDAHGYEQALGSMETPLDSLFRQAFFKKIPY